MAENIELKIAHLWNDIDKNPKRWRESFKKNSEKRAEDTRLLTLISDRIGQRTAYLPQVLERYLQHVKSATSVLFLAVGPGDELVHARRFFGAGKFLAIDHKMTASLVAIEHVTGTDVWQTDLTQITSKDVIARIGQTPDVVICRHPDFDSEPHMQGILSLWAKVMHQNDGTLMVTNFTADEVARVQAGVKPYARFFTQEFSGGIRYDYSNGSTTSDRFVTIAR